MARLQADPDSAAPSEFATFRKVSGDEGAMRPGDEYIVRMPGPWDGPVRVVEVSARSFRFMTLAGHLEAGQINFRVDGERRAHSLRDRVLGTQRRPPLQPPL